MDLNETKGKAPWTFLTNHSHVLLCLVKDPSLTMRDIATEVGITERAVQKIVSALVDGGFINRVKDGRKNSYTVNTEMHLRHPIEKHKTIEDLIELVYGASNNRPGK